jgi:hypothetical protein
MTEKELRQELIRKGKDRDQIEVIMMLEHTLKAG